MRRCQAALIRTGGRRRAATFERYAATYRICTAARAARAPATPADTDGDVLSFGVASQPATGAVSVTTNGNTATFTYTPTAAARQTAAQPGGQTQDSFTILVGDATAAPLAGTPITVTIAPPVLP